MFLIPQSLRPWHVKINVDAIFLDFYGDTHVQESDTKMSGSASRAALVPCLEERISLTIFTHIYKLFHFQASLCLFINTFASRLIVPHMYMYPGISCAHLHTCPGFPFPDKKGSFFSCCALPMEHSPCQSQRDSVDTCFQTLLKTFPPPNLVICLFPSCLVSCLCLSSSQLCSFHNSIEMLCTLLVI